MTDHKTRIAILEYEAREVFGANEDWETIKEMSRVLDYCENVQRGEEPIIASELAEFERRVKILLERP